MFWMIPVSRMCIDKVLMFIHGETADHTTFTWATTLSPSSSVSRPTTTDYTMSNRSSNKHGQKRSTQDFVPPDPDFFPPKPTSESVAMVLVPQCLIKNKKI